MGAYVSVPDCAAKYNVTLDCNTPAGLATVGGLVPGNVQPDPDIAGIGILGAFVAVTTFALILSTISVIWWFSKYILRWKKRLTEEEKMQRGRQFTFTGLLETLVLSCSDQQVFTGAAYAITLRYLKGCAISVYHYNIVANMLLLTCATHLAAVTISRRYWEYPVVAVLRIIVTVGVYLVTGLLLSNQGAAAEQLFPTEVPPEVPFSAIVDGTGGNATAATLLPLMFLSAACFQNEGTRILDTLKQSSHDVLGTLEGHQVHGWNHYLVMVLFFALTIIVQFGRSVRQLFPRRAMASIRRVKVVLYIIFGIYLLAGLCIAWWTVIDSTIYIINLRLSVHRSGWMATDGNTNAEDDPTSFGQLVPMLLILLTLFSFVQIISEKWSDKQQLESVNAAGDPEKRLYRAESDGNPKKHAAYITEVEINELPTPLVSESPRSLAEPSASVDSSTNSPLRTRTNSSGGGEPNASRSRASLDRRSPSQKQASRRDAIEARSRELARESRQLESSKHTRNYSRTLSDMGLPGQI